MSSETPPSLSGIHGQSPYFIKRRLSFKVDFFCFSFVMEANDHLQQRHRSSDLEKTRENRPLYPRWEVPTREDPPKLPLPPKPPSFRLHRKRIQLSSATIQDPLSLCSRCDRSSSLPLWSCAKITRSKGKQGRALNESTKALKKRLDSIHIDPETIDGHPPKRYVAYSWLPFIES